jgi:hypothetical protein
MACDGASAPPLTAASCASIASEDLIALTTTRFSAKRSPSQRRARAKDPHPGPLYPPPHPLSAASLLQICVKHTDDMVDSYVHACLPDAIDDVCSPPPEGPPDLHGGPGPLHGTRKECADGKDGHPVGSAAHGCQGGRKGRNIRHRSRITGSAPDIIWVDKPDESRPCHGSSRLRSMFVTCYDGGGGPTS